MRIDKFFSNSTILTLSRRDIRQAIKSRRVKVNGKIITDISFEVDKDSKIELDGEIVKYMEYVYCMLNKPIGYETTFAKTNNKTIYDLLPEYFIRKEIIPIGRLDKDTCGLLLLTNDGEFCHIVTSPKHMIEKEYKFKLADDIEQKDIDYLESGITLKDGDELKPCKISMHSKTEGNIIISEGKYHQIRRMFGAVGNKIIFLKRIREGNIILPNDLEEGKFILFDKMDIEGKK